MFGTLLILYFIIGIVVTIINVNDLDDNCWDVSTNNIIAAVIFPIHSAIAYSIIWAVFKLQLQIQKLKKRLNDREIDSDAIINLKDKIKGEEYGRRKGRFF